MAKRRGKDKKTTFTSLLLLPILLGTTTSKFIIIFGEGDSKHATADQIENWHLPQRKRRKKMRATEFFSFGKEGGG